MDIASHRFGDAPRRQPQALRHRSSGAAIIEAVVALPVLLVVILGTIQFALIYEAKATMNHASLQAARAGSFANAEVGAIGRGLARGLAPLSSPDSSVQGMVQTIGNINAQLATDARIRILNPTREAFADFGEDVDGQRELPNDRLHTRSTVIGTRSGLNIQDANLLRVEITYGFEMDVPLVNWFLSRVLLAANRVGVVGWDAFEQQLLRRNRLPVVATSTVRMQTPARLNDAMVAKSDLPEIARVDASSRPADDREPADDGEDAEGEGTSTPGEKEEGRSLADGAFGFHGDHPGENPQGSGDAPAPGGSGSGPGSGPNSGSPAACSGSSDSGGVRDGFESPGNEQSSPVEPRPNPIFSATEGSSGAASLPNNSLPSLAVGNPIHVVTGNKYQAEIDLPALPGRLGLVLSRHYNSEAAAHMGVFGAGWRHAFEARVLVDHESADRIRLVQADGRVITFGRLDDATDRYRASRASDGDLFVQPSQGYRWRWLDGRELNFDTVGALASITQRGERVQFTYANDRLMRVTDPQLRSLTFAYYPNGRISQITGPAGFVARYRYDSEGNLAEVVYSDGTGRVYQYEAAGLPHHLTGISARDASVREFGKSAQQVAIAAWTYDANGRAISSSHPDNAGKVTLQYGDGYTNVTDTFGRASRYEYEWIDGIARITSVHGPGCGSCGRGEVSYVYGDRFSITDIHIAHQPSRHYRYDAQGRVEQVERTDLDGERGWLMRFHYEGDSWFPGRIEQPSVNPLGLRITRIQSDANGNPSRITETGYSPTTSGSYTPIERSVQLEFDPKSRLLAVDGPRQGASDTVTLKYDLLGRLMEWRAPDQRLASVLKHDAAGRILALRSETGAPLRFEYDSRGRPLSVRQQIGATDRQLQYEYDGVGRLAAIVDGNGRRRHFRYDASNRLNHLSAGSVYEQHVYTPDDLPVRSSLLTSSGYALRTLYFIYDAQRRLTETRDGDGPPLQQLRYLDADDRPDVILDPLGAETHLAYNSLGQLNRVRAADGGETRFQFDHLQQLTAVIAPNGAHTRYRYDDFGRRVEDVSPDRGRLRYDYDSSGNLIRKTDARNFVTQYEYDAANRLVRIQQREGTTTLHYQGTKLLSVSSPDANEHRKYDEDGRLIEHSRRINGHPFVTAYQYDAAGKLIAKRLPSGARLLYTYNSNGQLVGIGTQRGFRTRLLIGSDDPSSSSPPLDAGMLGDVKLGNGLTTRTRLDLESGGIAYRGTDGITRFTYRRDAAGRIVGVDLPDRSSTYSYDAAGRLTSARSPGEQLTYEYDSNGNRVSSTWSTAAGITRTSLRYQKNSNKLLSIESSDAAYAANYTYDPSGNPSSAGPWRYEYDTNGRLRRLYHSGILRAEYAYNAQGERVQKDVYVSGRKERTFFLYENHQLVAEANGLGRITREYLYAGRHPVALLAGQDTYSIHTDQLGTPWALTNKQGMAIWTAHYSPFGETIANADPDGDRQPMDFNLRFPGQYMDQESNTYYNYFRDYDPRAGRYLTPDPAGTFDSTNSFTYVHANPIQSADSLGLYDEMVHYYMTYFLGIVAGLPQDVARTIALASAYIDENPLTQPVNYMLVANQRALPLYHFVLPDGGPLYGDRTTDTLTRFFNPQSGQLNNLLSSTDEVRLRELWVQTHPSSVPDACPAPDRDAISRARQQLYGEYLHAFEDTFAHRDLLNVPYGVTRRDDNNPSAHFGGHTGLYGTNPFQFEQPDRTYNQDEDDEPSQCEIRYVIGGRKTLEGIAEQACTDIARRPGVASTNFIPRPSKCIYVYARSSEDLLGTRKEVRGITEEQCNEAATAVHADEMHFLPQGDLWAYNELRTLRMEYEMLGMLTSAFSDEIAKNRAQNGDRVPNIKWEQLAGRAWDERNAEANARIGLEQSYEEWVKSQGLSEAAAVLQKYNSSDIDED